MTIQVIVRLAYKLLRSSALFCLTVYPSIGELFYRLVLAEVALSLEKPQYSKRCSSG